MGKVAVILFAIILKIVISIVQLTQNCLPLSGAGRSRRAVFSSKRISSLFRQINMAALNECHYAGVRNIHVDR